MATAKTETTVKNAAAVQMPTARTPEQQAALDQARADKAKAAEAAVAKTADPTVKTEMVERLLKQLSALDWLLNPETQDGEVITWKRKAAAFFATLSLAGGAGYLIGQVAGYAMVGCFALTGSLFLTYTILFLAIILAFYAGMKIGQHVGNYILSGQIDRDFVAAKNKVTGWFKSKPVVPVAATPAAVQ